MKLTLILLLFTIQSYCQRIESDWSDFKDEKWNTEISTGSQFLGRTLQGELKFVNIRNPNKNVTYYVLFRHQKDQQLEQDLHDYYYKQSCAYESVKLIQFDSFEKGDFFYVLKPCYNCNLKDEECRNLSERIFLYSRE